MTEPTFSEKLIEVFRASGWSETRRVDIEPVRELFHSRGIEMHGAAELILQQFHGLTIGPPLNPVIFDVPRLLDWMKPEEPDYLAGLIGEPLCPIGEGGWCYLLLSPSGQAVFLGDDWTYVTHFPTLNQALEAVLIQSTSDWESQTVPEELRPPSFRYSQLPGAQPRRESV